MSICAERNAKHVVVSSTYILMAHTHTVHFFWFSPHSSFPSTLMVTAATDGRQKKRHSNRSMHDNSRSLCQMHFFSLLFPFLFVLKHTFCGAVQIYLLLLGHISCSQKIACQRNCGCAFSRYTTIFIAVN